MAEDTDQKSASLVSDLLSEFLAAVVHQYNTVSPGRAGRPSRKARRTPGRAGRPQELRITWRYSCQLLNTHISGMCNAFHTWLKTSLLQTIHLVLHGGRHGDDDPDVLVPADGARH